MMEYNEHPLVSQDAEPLKHLHGNEYELGWRSIWIHTPKEAVRILYRDTRLQCEFVRKTIERRYDNGDSSMQRVEAYPSFD